MELAGDPDKKEKYQVAHSKLVDFFRYFDKHRVYLPEDLCESLEALAMKVRGHVIHFSVYLRYDHATMLEHTRR
ncbi:hypothetical protein LP414_21580 [Polaromonas sp. P1(28)-13]|nr:hypothetical protein LP414_21580 [Polaromonas sp. P1(28)-13]